MLKYEVPHVYDIILSMTQPDVFREPPFLLVKLVCKNSSDLSLQKPKFFRYLEEYRDTGLFCKRPKIITPERKLYYEAIRKKKLDNFIANNEEKINRMRKK